MLPVEPRKELVRTQLARHFGCDREEIAIVRNASWIDPAADGGPRIAVLLSNRVHLGRDDARIRDARQAFHAAAARLR